MNTGTIAAVRKAIAHDDAVLDGFIAQSIDKHPNRMKKIGWIASHN